MGYQLLSEFVSRTTYEQIPPEVVERAKLILLDTLGVIVAGSKREACIKTFDANFAGKSIAGGSTILGSGKVVNPFLATLINGTAAVVPELDEGNRFAGGHMACHLLPPLLALAETEEVSGKNFLTATIVGYEVGIRLGLSCNLRPAVHPHGVWPIVGAAAGVGKLLGLPREKVHMALNIAASLALATSWQSALEGVTVRNIYVGLGSCNGMLSAYLARDGFTAMDEAFKFVYGGVLAENFNETKMLKGLGQVYELMNNYFKFHACCGINHTPLDAVAEITAKHRVDPKEIERIEVKTFKAATMLTGDYPRTELGAKFSIPYAIAAALVFGSAKMESFNDESRRDPLVKEIFNKVIVVEEPEYTKAHPATKPTTVTLYLRQGGAFTATATIPWGSSDNPCGKNDVVNKFKELTQASLGTEVVERIFLQVNELEKLSSMRLLLANFKSA